MTVHVGSFITESIVAARRLIVVCSVLAMAGNVCRAQEVSFSQDVRPILSGRCFKCHGPDAEAREGDLRLDKRKDAIDVDAIVPGAPDSSTIVERITSTDPDTRMPPNGEPLSKVEIERLSAWIKSGAKYEKHWAYVKPNEPEVPERTNAIDHFVRRRLNAHGLKPSPQAEPAVLIRRLSLDLIGLPPTIEQVQAFERHPSDSNYEAEIDRLLASKHFGEKWALHWLDLARYADSNGYQHDDLRTMWPYRDWVVKAFNDDMPFDKFTIDQLAGDLLPNPTRDQLIATGFHRNVATNFSGGAKVAEIRANILHDRVSTTGQVWLGMTMECCQCHDHKFDPIPQTDYYRLYAYFNLAIPEVAREGPAMFKKKFIGADVAYFPSEQIESKVNAIDRQIKLEQAALNRAKPWARERQAEWENEFRDSGRGDSIPWERFPWSLRGGARMLNIPREQRTADESANIEALLFYDHPLTGPYVRATDRLREAIAELAPRTMVMQDSETPVATHVFDRGDYASPGLRVRPGTPGILHALDPGLPPNRLGLAKWIIHPDNPLTARVTVNRFWAELFGQGIVSTPEDFGMQSAPASHPELLDWLAVDFVHNGWSMKKLIKTMVMSSTYRQTAAVPPAKISSDPTNRWLAHGPRLRLTGELIRDNALAIAGQLTETIGGPSVYPPQPDGLWQEISGADVTVYPTSLGEDRFRRGLYTFLRRGNPNPMLLNFDGSNRSSCTLKRDRSNTPVQALNLLNDPVFVEATRAFAELIQRSEGDVETKVTMAFRRAVARRPTEAEIRSLTRLHRKHGDWFSVAQVLLNLDETITK